MAAEDIVTYNGVPMRRDFAETPEASRLCPPTRGHGALFPRLRPGDVHGMAGYHRGRPRSRCCNAVTGQLHDPLCEDEECPRCGLQVMSCDCEFMTDDAVPAG